ncbi:MAG: hypothetical protein IPK60_00970 [Sandaracinaceae bacterium]|nr:hypothetical protein [Sandaracinaceae bacterium]
MLFRCTLLVFVLTGGVSACASGIVNEAHDLGLLVDSGARDAPALDAQAADAGFDAASATDSGASMDAGADAQLDAGSASDSGSTRDAGTDMGAVAVDCFLPSPYRAYPMAPWLVYLSAAPITSSAGLAASERIQIVEAVHQSAHTDVITVDEAIAAVDDMTVERFWDDSNAKEVHVYTYYAGDNRYGGAFEADSSALLAAITDGDVTSCTRPRGGLHAVCASSASCISPEVCYGLFSGEGKCVDSAPILGQGDECSSWDGCAIDFGLVCTMFHGATSGMCMPAWMQTVVPVSVGAVASGGFVDVTVPVSGIATVDIAVSLGVYAPSHPRPTDLRIVVTNPDTSMSSATITNSAQVHGLIREELPLFYSGDERVNGAWNVRVYDDGSGAAGTVESVWLRIKSRLD